MPPEETPLRQFWRLHFTFFENWKSKFNRTKFSGGYHTRELPKHGDRYRKAREKWIYANGYPEEVPPPYRVAGPGFWGQGTNKRKYIAKQRRLRVT